MTTDTLTIFGIDGLTEAFDRNEIKRGDLCEITREIDLARVERPPFYVSRHAAYEDPRWARACQLVGAILFFLAVIGGGVIGCYLVLGSVFSGT